MFEDLHDRVGDDHVGHVPIGMVVAFLGLEGAVLVGTVRNREYAL